MVVLRSMVVVLLVQAVVVHADGCTQDSDCLHRPDGLWRCLQVPPPGTEGSACTLDYAYNDTGICACAAQDCTTASYTPPVKDAHQLLVLGDSISIGYLTPLTRNLGSAYQVSRPTGNCGNTNFGNRCLAGWLGPDPHRWDAITVNFGLHDLAFPDNEHVAPPDYSSLLTSILHNIRNATRDDTKLLWITTTPVPTNPPPRCALIPGRTEVDVLAYNKVAGGVVAAVGGIDTCDAHETVVQACGLGYSACNITQCQGPHFTDQGFQLIANTIAQCLA